MKSRQKKAPQKKLPYGWALWGAVGATILLWFIPFGRLALYPLSILATWAHEMGHGLTALLVGGSFDQLQLFANGGGLAHTRTSSDLARALVSAGGLVGTPLAGTAIIVLGGWQRLARPVLIALVLALLVTAILWARNLFGLCACLTLAALIGGGAWKLGPRMRFFLVQLLGVQLAVSSMRGMDYLFAAEAVFGTERYPSDVANIATALGGHYLAWGFAILVLELALLYGAYRLVYFRLDRDSAYTTR